MKKLVKKNIGDVFALTQIQEGILFHYLKEPGSDLYFNQFFLEISGELDIQRFTAAWQAVINTNEMLRTFFRWESVKNPLQIILKEHTLQLKYMDFSSKSGKEKIDALEKLKQQDRKEGFDLREVPFRIMLCKLKANTYQMIMSYHHILFDGWSNGIILKEFFEAYRHQDNDKGERKPPINPEPPLKSKFKEFVHRVQHQGEKKEQSKMFWKTYLAGFDGGTQIQVKREKKNSKKKRIHEGDIQRQFLVSPGVGNSFPDFSKAFNITPAVLFYCAWGILLHRYSNTEDVLIGTTVSGRSARIPGIEDMVGLFINTLPLRVQASRSEKIEKLLYRINSHLQEREPYELTPLVAVKDYSLLHNKDSLFNSLVVVENYPIDMSLIQPGGNLSLTAYSSHEKTNYDVTIVIQTQFQDRLTVDFNCNNDFFDDVAVEQIGRHYMLILEYMLRNPEKQINEIDILSSSEKKQLLLDFNDTQSEFLLKKSIVQLFEESVEQYPDNIALVAPFAGSMPPFQGKNTPGKHIFPTTSNIQLSYRELNKKANQLASLLAKNGVKTDTIVAITIERSIEMIIGILGILKTGGAYLPIDPHYPKERIYYILEDSRVNFLVKKGKIFFDIKKTKELLVPDFDGLNPEHYLQQHDFEFRCSNTHDANLAYIIYTSGSTGQPKGVLVEQSSLLNLLIALQELYPLSQQDVYLLKTSFMFDVSLTELLGWIPGGGRLCILGPGDEKNPREILDTIEKHRVTHINFVPSMFSMFTSILNPGNIHKISSLKYVFLAGEALLPEQVNRFTHLNSKILLENIYGPTEGTVYASKFSLSRWDSHSSIPIGKPLPSTKLVILDKGGQLQPIGVPGELFISGLGLARGYLNRPELTSERFILATKTQRHKDVSFSWYHRSLVAKLYKTGDLARWLMDGNIEYLGRMDFQVKIRGFRIELGEIESQLLSYQDITEAAVTTIEDQPGMQGLCGYFAAEKELEPLPLKQYLTRKLPHYMVPAYLVQLDKIPLTPSGKIDRKLLPHPREKQPARKVSYTRPGNELEKQIADTWKQVLQLDNIDINDNFFDAGGNSLSIIRLNSRLNEILHKDIPLVTLFNYPTISSLAAYLQQDEKDIEASRIKKSPVPKKKAFPTGSEIAVIGLAGRFPGAKNITEFWENLKNGVEGISFFNENESIDAGIDPQLCGTAGYISAKGVLEDKNNFDALFFGYTPPEAEIMDPQVRIFHECCWEALEDAGYNPETYDGLIGLYAGASPNPFWEILPLRSHPDPDSYARNWEAIQFSDKDYLSTRIAYKLDLKGPAVTMQTACSTSLVVVNLACQGLLNGSSDIALAGGISVTLHDDWGYVYQEGTIMSPDGHCRAFDAKANGTVGGNGAGVVVLKRLDEAVKDRDNIYAVIKGFAINNDGKNKVGFTAPSVEGQSRAIRAAQQMAGVESESICFIETHGTGTPLGDTIEIEALKQVFHLPDNEKKNYCALGSVKTNIGHLDAAAGIAGLIKTILALKHKIIPPGLHFQESNPNIDLDNSPFYFNNLLKYWRNEHYPLRAGVSSFGLGGTNAHVILEEAPTPTTVDPVPVPFHVPFHSREFQLILLSAKNPDALALKAEHLKHYLEGNPAINLADAAFTLHLGRKVFAYRKMLVCSNPEEVVRKIQAGEVETGQAKKEKPTVIFMFSGQGSQYVNMGLDLYHREPAFQNQVNHCFKLLENITGKNMMPVLYPDKENFDDAEIKINQFIYTSPIKFIFEYSLAVLLMEWGIQPDAMIGHSFGEYAAACISGVFSLEDALFLAALRGELMHGLPDGAMLSVPLPEKELKPLLNEQISLAAVNSESMCVVSGPVHVIDTLEKELNEKGLDCLRYHVPKAGHSWMVEPILAEFKEKISRVNFNKPQIPYVSGLTGKWITAEEAINPGYWTRHLRETVRFADGLTTLFKKPEPIFLQVGPGRGLTLFVQQHPEKKSGTPTINLVRHRKEKISDVYHTLNKIGQLWLHGVPLDGERFYSGQQRCRISLPAYPFAGRFYPPPKDLLKTDVNSSLPKNLLTQKTDMSDWFYIPVWEHAPFVLTSFPTTTDRKTPTPSNWLLFMDDLGLGARLIQALPEAAGTVVQVQVKAGERYTRENENSYILNPGQADDYDRLVHDVRQSGLLPDKIIHLWSVTDNHEREGRLQELDRIQELGFYSLFYLVQALGRQDISREMQINIVTNNMQSVTGEEETCPEKATIRGAVKIIPLEYVNIKCTNIDILLPGTGPANQIQDKLVRQLLNELMNDQDSPDRIIALRGNRRWCETMRPCRLEKPGPSKELLKEKGVYLITGGLGGMGFTLAQYLATHFRAKLILVGRSFFPARQDWNKWLVDHPGEDKVSAKIKQILESEESGAEIMVCCADVSSLEQMQEVINEAHHRFGPINGVLHTAGVGDYAGMIRQRTRQMTEQVMAPKVKGTLVLEEVLKDDGLDFLVLFSSIGNIIYQVKFAQVGYNAANEFLEAFAYYKNRKDGTYTITINWNDWLEVGMSIEAADRKFRKHWKYKTMGDDSEIDYESAIHAGITPVQGVEIFRRILGQPLERVTVSMMDLDDMMRVLKGLKKKDSSTIEAIDQQAASQVVEKRPPLQTPYIPPANAVEEALCKTWSSYFGIEPVGTEDDFFELGGDSLKAMIITQKIHKEMEVRIPLADFFNNPTIKGQAEYIRLNKLHSHEAEQKLYSAIPPVEKKEYYGLSSAQQRIYVLHQMATRSIGYNITHSVLLDGEVDTKRLEETFSRLIRRHESLRTSFHLVENQPVQKVLREGNYRFRITYEEMPIDSPPDIPRIAAESVRNFVSPFDLSQAPLLRVALVKLSGTRYILMMDTHHIISDGTSVDVLIKDFTAFYRGDGIPGLRLQYKDYSEWQLRQSCEKSGSETIRTQESFWLNQLAGELPVLSLPFDFPRPPVQSFEGGSFHFEIDARKTKELKALAMEEETTLFTVLLALGNTWLARLSGQEDIILGSVTAGRKFEELQHVMGMFVNTLVLRNFPSGEKTFKEFLEEVRRRTLAAFENQDYPFKDLVEKAALKRDTSRNPLFDVMFILQSIDISHPPIPGLTMKSCPFTTGISKFDLSLEGVEQENKLVFKIEYCTKLFKPETIERISHSFCRLVSGVIGNPDMELCDIEIISEEEKKKILLDFNDTRRDYPADKTLQQIFTELAAIAPDDIALAGPLMVKNNAGVSDLIYISYRLLNEKADHAARLLQAQGVKPGHVVGMMMERSIGMIIALLGILKAGGAYLPIDTGFPGERIEYMMADSSAKILVTSSSLENKVKELKTNCPTIFIDAFQEFDSPASQLLAFPSFDSTNLVYVIYTSGSTGKPKGVLVEHRNVVRLVKNQNFIHYQKGDKLLPTGSVIFDISTFEIWWPLLNRLIMVLTDESTILDAELLEKTLVKHNITILHLVPQVFNQLAAQNIQLFGHINYFLVGGDVVNPEYVNRIRNRYPDLKILHMYGPTENTTFSTFFPVDREFSGSIPIGTPIGNSTAFILDRYARLQPIGITGELFVGGNGLARGYLNRPELTVERFCLRRPGGALFVKTAPPGPPGKNFLLNQTLLQKSAGSGGEKARLLEKSIPGRRWQKIYKTGDLARWLADGNIEFLGRIDQQVKIRGIRIELGEIENRLLTHEMVNEAAVVTRGECLCAYIVTAPDNSSAFPAHTSAGASISRELKTYLAQFLPGYMIPAYFIPLPSLPVTPGGKIDRKALPEPETDAREQYIAPRNETEKKLVEIWSGILNRKTGIDNNFFELGGHSLNAAVLISKIHREFNVKLSLTEFFSKPFIRETAEYIKQASGEDYIPLEPMEKREYYPLSSAQLRLYVLQLMEKEGIGYNMVTVVFLEGELDNDRLEETFRELIRRHDSFRTSFHMLDNKAVQKIHEAVEFELKRHDALTATKGEEQNKAINAFIKPFDLSRAPLLRVYLLKTNENRYSLVLDMHHIICDGTSMGILVREFMELYAGKNLPGLKTQYKDYSQWQQLEKQRNALKKQKDYWLGHLSGELPMLTLPTDYPRPLVQSFSGRTITFESDKNSAVLLKEMARRADVTLFMIILAAFNVFLSRLSGQEDIVVGIPVTERRYDDWQHIIGMFVNTLASRNRPRGENSFSDFLQQLKTRVLAAFENQEYPFEDLVENLEIKRDTGRNPIFDVMFAFQNFDIPVVEIPGLKLEPYDLDIGISKFDLILEVLGNGEHDEYLRFRWQYCTALFKPETIERFIDYFKNILSAIIENPDRLISGIEVMSEEEKQHVLVDFNDTAVSFPGDKTLHQLIEEQVEKTPNHIALTGPETSGEQILEVFTGTISVTYRELNRKADQLAQLLRERGVQPDMVVGIMVERSMGIIAGILGILKAGGAYLPIDPEYPQERIDYMLRDSNAEICLTNRDIINLSLGEPNHNHPQGACPGRHMLPVPVTALAYIIYTSGTTGRPKGVMVEHGNAVNVVTWFARSYDLGRGRHVLQMSELTFDPSVNQVFGTFISGAVLYLIPKELLFNGDMLRGFIDRHQIHVLNFVPVMLNELLGFGKKLESVRVVLSGGEKLDEHIKNNILKKGYPLYNQYGPTETTIDALVEQCTPDNAVTLGKPISNTSCYILDRHQMPVPPGVTGELYISGTGVTRGYLNNPELTNQKFFQEMAGPGGTVFSKRVPPGRRRQTLYKTGDLARWLPNGTVEFSGRKDRQVKVRGYRVELAEIEQAVMRYPGIETCITEIIDSNQIIAYMKPHPRITLRPSWAEQFVYDDMAYYAMASDEFRNRKYRNVFNKKLKDKLVLEIGPGSDICLTRLCLEAGARKVIAVEILEDAYRKARQKIETLGLEDRIQLIHGDVTEISLPEKCDYCVSEIVGSVGGMQGAAKIINAARGMLKNPANMIPLRSLTKIAAITLPGEKFDYSFDDVGAHYTGKIFEKVGYRFDLRVCLYNFPKEDIISTADTFEDLDFSETNRLEEEHEIYLEIKNDSVLNGLLAWLQLYIDENEIIDTLANESLWLPLYFPVFSQGMAVKQGDYIKANVTRKLSRNNLNPDYLVRGTLYRSGITPVDFSYHSFNEEPEFHKNDFYKKIFPGNGSDASNGSNEYNGIRREKKIEAEEMREFLKGVLPGHMIPSQFVQLDKIPLTAIGKVDRAALPRPGIAKTKNYTAPRNEIERRLVKIWSDVLGEAAGIAGIDDNFFEMGGHSLKATSLASNIHKEFNVRLSLSEFFKAPFIRQTAVYIQNSTGETYFPLEPVEKKEYYSLSPAHKRLYVLQELESDSISYNMCAVFSVAGEPDRERLAETFQTLIRRHDSFRTSFHMMEKEPVQRTCERVEFEVEYQQVDVDGESCGQISNACSGHSLHSQEQRVERVISAFIRPFDLSRAPLLRVGLIALHSPVNRRSSPGGSLTDYILVADMHHIISDGTSIGTLMGEFMAVYSGKTLPELRIQYKDYTEWQEKTRNSRFMKKQEEYWLQELQGELKQLNLPHDFPRPEIRQFKGWHLDFEIPEHRAEALKQLALAHDTTLYVVLLLVINIFLAKLCGQEEIIIGTAVANRRHADLEPIMGMFVNTLVLRNYPGGDKTVIEFLDQVKDNTLKAHENQEYPFDDLVEKMVGKRARDAARNPLFDVIFALHNMEMPEVQIPGLKFSPYSYETGISQFDLIITGFEEEKKLKMQFSYSANLFREETVQRFIRYFQEVIGLVLENQEKKIKDIEISHELREPKAEIFQEARGDFSF